jgi:hypothetical protein
VVEAVGDDGDEAEDPEEGDIAEHGV